MEGLRLQVWLKLSVWVSVGVLAAVGEGLACQAHTQPAPEVPPTTHATHELHVNEALVNCHLDN